MEQLLKKFGLSNPEIAVYRALLTLGGATVSSVAVKTKLKRTSCQEYIRSLEAWGFVNFAQIGKKYFYQIEDPDTFRQIINEREFVVDRLLEKLKNRPSKEEWRVHTMTVGDVQKKLRRAKRKEQELFTFGGEKVGGALLSNQSILLFSTNAEIPALEIVSKELVEWHKSILKQK